MKKMFIVMIMVVMVVTGSFTAYAAQMTDLQTEEYEKAMDQFYWQDGDCECYIHIPSKNPNNWEITVVNDSYKAMIYSDINNETRYGSIYTKNGSFIGNLSTDDVERIVSRFG